MIAEPTHNASPHSPELPSKAGVLGRIWSNIKAIAPPDSEALPNRRAYLSATARVPENHPQTTVIRGYISEQPVLKETYQGIAYVRLLIAANEIVCDGESRDPQTDMWHSVVFFGRRAHEMCKLHIGDRVRLRGDRLLATENKGRWLVVVSNIINPVLELLPADKPSSIETQGWVFVEPQLQRYIDGTCFVRVMIEAESVRVQGKLRDANHTDHRWQFAIFLDQQAETFVATAKTGAKVRITGDLTFLPWVQPGQRFSTNEIRNATFSLITPAHGHISRD